VVMHELIKFLVKITSEKQNRTRPKQIVVCAYERVECILPLSPLSSTTMFFFPFLVLGLDLTTLHLRQLLKWPPLRCRKSADMLPQITYSLRSIILFANIDVSRHILIVDTSVYAKSNMDRGEYFGVAKCNTY
jgi:hypothetical protein